MVGIVAYFVGRSYDWETLTSGSLKLKLMMMLKLGGRSIRSPVVILCHHLVAAGYMYFPYNYPAHRPYMSYLMMVELNTWLLIAKRNLKFKVWSEVATEDNLTEAVRSCICMACNAYKLSKQCVQVTV